MDKILITTSSFGKYDTRLIQDIVGQGFECVLNPLGRKLTEKEALDLIVKHQPLGMIAGVEPLTRKVLEKARNLKIISRCGIGMDSVDIAAANDMGISVKNTPDAPTIPVAELTMGLILSLLRKIHISHGNIRKGDWERPMGNLLYGKTVGIVGCGRIGKYLAKLLSSFGCRMLGCDIIHGQTECYEPLKLDPLLVQSDIISLHLPYSKETHHYINSKRIQIMKDGVMIINAARGGLIDEIALFKALKDGKVAGAAIDCFEEEPYKGPLREFDNVLLTGHIGSYAKEGRMMMEKQALDNLLDGLCLKGVL